MLCLGQNTQTPQLFIQIPHKVGNTGADRSKIVVVQFLALGRLCTKKRASGKTEVFTLSINGFGNQEILLFGTNADANLLGFGIAKQTQYANGFPGNFVDRTEQRCFFVKRFSGIRKETGGDIQASILYKCKGGRIPGGIAAGFKGCTKAAGREGRSIRLTLDQFFSGKFHNDFSVTGRCNKRVVFLSGDAGHRLKPMGIVSCTFFQCPNLHSLCNFVCNIQGQRTAILNALFPRVICICGQPLLHSRLVKNIASKNFRNV